MRSFCRVLLFSGRRSFGVRLSTWCELLASVTKISSHSSCRFIRRFIGCRCSRAFFLYSGFDSRTASTRTRLTSYFHLRAFTTVGSKILKNPCPGLFISYLSLFQRHLFAIQSIFAISRQIAVGRRNITFTMATV